MWRVYLIEFIFTLIISIGWVNLIDKEKKYNDKNKQDKEQP